MWYSRMGSNSGLFRSCVCERPRVAAAAVNAASLGAKMVTDSRGSESVSAAKWCLISQ